MTTSTIIGDSQDKAEQPVVSSLPISVVAEADVIDKASAVNNEHLSGKKEGAMYVMKETTGGELIIIIADGSETTSKWYRQDDLTAVITPA